MLRDKKGFQISQGQGIYQEVVRPISIFARGDGGDIAGVVLIGQCRVTYGKLHKRSEQ